MKFNINYYVRVRLTDYGREILRKGFEKRNRMFPSVFREFIPPEEDSEGWSKWQMWDLMARFGEYIHLGGEMPFETTIDILNEETS